MRPRVGRVRPAHEEPAQVIRAGIAHASAVPDHHSLSASPPRHHALCRETLHNIRYAVLFIVGQSHILPVFNQLAEESIRARGSPQ